MKEKDNYKVLQSIVMDIYDSGWLENECRKICKDRDLREDLFQEIILIILEFKEDGGLQKAFSKKQHEPFIKRIIMNQFNSVTSPFYHKYKKHRMNIQVEEEITMNNSNEEYGD